MKKVKIKSQSNNQKIPQVFFVIIFYLVFLGNLFSQNQLEFANSSYSLAPNGLTTANQTAVLLENTTGNIFNTFSPNISVTASISNQQYNGIPSGIISTTKGMSFGGRVNNLSNSATQVPVFNYMNSINNPRNIDYTSNPNGPSSAGIVVDTNSAFYIYNSVYPLFNTSQAVNGRFYYGDITLTFSSPVSNPVIHIVGLGANINFGASNIQGFSSELEMQTPGLTLSKLSGSNEFDVTNNKILNSSANPSYTCNSGAACGSVKVSGSNITTISFKIYLRGDGSGNAWGHANINAGDEFMIGVSINKPVTLAGNIFRDINGLTDNTVNGIGNNAGGLLYANLIDTNNLVVANSVVASDGSYTFNAISSGNYKIVLSTIAGIQGNLATVASLPLNWVFTGENIGNTTGNDGTVNGEISIVVNAAAIPNINFGINICPTFSNASANQSVCVGSNGNNFTFQTNFNEINSIRFVKFTTNQIAGGLPTNSELAAIYAGGTIDVVTPTGTSAPFNVTHVWNSANFPNTTNNPITYYVYAIVNPDMGLTCRPIQSYTVTINPLPIVTNNANMCVGTTMALTPNTGGSWASSNSSIASVNNSGIITALTIGNVSFTYTQTSTGCSASSANITINPCIIANTENGTVTSIGGVAITNVVSNDSVAGTTASLGISGNATVSQLGTWPSGISLNTTTGAILVISGKPSGVYPVQYLLCDKLTPSNCAFVTDTITVFNSVPIAFADTFSTFEDVNLSGNLATNDTLSGDGGNIWSVFSVPSKGTVTINPNGTFTYIPNPNYNGLDSFVYQLCDVNNDCDTAIVRVNIISVNDLPLANRDTINTTENIPVDIYVLNNDSFGGDGPSTGSISIISNANHGFASVANNGTPNDPTDDFITYIPTPSYDGFDTIVYRICDFNNDCDTAVVYIKVENCKTTSTTTVNVCSNSLPYVWNGFTFNSAGNHVVNLTNLAGCDSIATLVLNVNPTSSSTSNISVCSSLLPFVWNGNNYTNSGTYLVNLTNSLGCDSAATLVLQVKPVSSSTTNLTICNSLLPYTWNGLIFSGAGLQTAILTNSVGCDSLATLNLLISLPTASTTTVNLCTNSFPFSWNGNTYTSAGTYLVNLTNVAGCDSAATLVLHNILAPSASVNENVVCGGGRVVLTGSIPTTGIWSQKGSNASGANLGNTNAGIANVLFANNANSMYSFIYTVGNGCSDTVDVFAGKPTASFSYIKKCNGKVEFINTSTNANDYEWIFGNGGLCTPFKDTITRTYTSNSISGITYNVSLIAKNNGVCADTISQLITIYPNAVAIFNAETNGCSTKVNFNNYSINSSNYIWDFGVTNLTNDTSSLATTTYTYPSSGVYLVKLISKNTEGCGDTLSHTITVNSTGVAPTANFTINNVSSACANRYEFVNTSINAVSYQWIFSDTTIIYTTNASKSFATIGNYQVKLVARSITGCYDTIVKTVNVNINSTGAVASFQVNQRKSCLSGNRYEFVNTSVFMGGGWIPNHEWDFGDGSPVNTNSSVYNKNFASSGVYTIRLISTGSDGCKDTAYQSIEILPSPIANFTANTGCGMTAAISNQTTGAISNIWNFGDGSFMQKNDSVFNYRYKTENFYFVTLTAIGSNGCRDSIDKGVLPTRAGAPEPYFTFDTIGCSGAIKFNNLTVGGASTSWDFGDGSPLSSTYHPTKAYAVKGTYTVTLNVSSGPFCSASYTAFVGAPIGQDFALPKVGLAYHIAGCSNTISGTDTSSNVTNRQWYFDNVLVGVLPTVTITNPSLGGHNLKLVVSNGNCYDSITQLIIIQPTPVSKFTHQVSTCSRTVLFSSRASVGHTYNWKFNDVGAVVDTGVGAFVSHTFSTNGTYIVSLKTTNLSGCNAFITDTIIVNSSGNTLNASFKYNNTTCNCVCNNKINFTNTTTGNANSFLWNFGDGNSSTQENPNKGYAAAGYYTATLTVSDTVGCFSIASAQVYVPEGSKGPSASFNTDNPIQCFLGNNYSFYNTSSYMGDGYTKKYYWYFGDGTFDTINNYIFNKRYASVGTYKVMLVAVGNDNCRDTMTLVVQVRNNNCLSASKPIQIFNPADTDFKNAKLDTTTSVFEYKTKTNSWKLYPNPNAGKFSIHSESLSKDCEVEVIDILGRKVSANIHCIFAENRIEVTTQALSSGYYFVIIKNKIGEEVRLKFNITTD